MLVVPDPCLCILSGNIDHRTLCNSLYGNRSAGHFRQNGHLPDKINGPVCFDHIYFSIFKFINDPVFTFCNNAEKLKLTVLLVDQLSRRINLDKGLFSYFLRHGFCVFYKTGDFFFQIFHCHKHSPFAYIP